MSPSSSSSASPPDLCRACGAKLPRDDHPEPDPDMVKFLGGVNVVICPTIEPGQFYLLPSWTT